MSSPRAPLSCDRCLQSAQPLVNHSLSMAVFVDRLDGCRIGPLVRLALCSACESELVNSPGLPAWLVPAPPGSMALGD